MTASCSAGATRAKSITVPDVGGVLGGLVDDGAVGGLLHENSDGLLLTQIICGGDRMTSGSEWPLHESIAFGNTELALIDAPGDARVADGAKAERLVRHAECGGGGGGGGAGGWG